MLFLLFCSSVFCVEGPIGVSSQSGVVSTPMERSPESSPGISPQKATPPELSKFISDQDWLALLCVPLHMIEELANDCSALRAQASRVAPRVV